MVLTSTEGSLSRPVPIQLTRPGLGPNKNEARLALVLGSRPVGCIGEADPSISRIAEMPTVNYCMKKQGSLKVANTSYYSQTIPKSKM